MLRIKKILFHIFILLFLISCIEEYIPNIELSESNKYVVMGCITDQAGYQTVSVSLTSSLQNPELIPLSDCVVKILDDNGTVFLLNEFSDGNYHAWIDQKDLNIGTSYMVQIITPNGTEISSDFDQMYECPEVDSIYYNRTDKPTNNPDVNIPGIQFHTDFKALNSNHHLYKIELEETWEYYAKYAIDSYFNGEMHYLFPPDSSLIKCWKTENVNEIFTLTTENFAQNQYKMYPLHFVDNTTQRLKNGYSLLVKQYSLSNTAFTYWDELKTINENEGLYEKQPYSVSGNLKNVSNPDQKVLGIFYATSVKQKRIFVEKVDIDFDYNDYCGLQRLWPEDFDDFTPILYPIYIAMVDSEQVILSDYCVDCRKQGGSLSKPSFWPKNL